MCSFPWYAQSVSVFRERCMWCRARDRLSIVICDRHMFYVLNMGRKQISKIRRYFNYCGEKKTSSCILEGCVAVLKDGRLSASVATKESGPQQGMASEVEVGVTAAGPVTAPHNKRPTTILVYPTVSPESIVIPIVSCILGFPLLALLVICCLRRRAKLARERARRRAGNCDDRGTLSLVRFSPIHRLVAGCGRTGRAVSLSRERALSRGFPSLELELDTVVEERSDAEPDMTATTDMATTPDSS